MGPAPGRVPPGARPGHHRPQPSRGTRPRRSRNGSGESGSRWRAAIPSASTARKGPGAGRDGGRAPASCSVAPGRARASAWPRRPRASHVVGPPRRTGPPGRRAHRSPQPHRPNPPACRGRGPAPPRPSAGPSRCGRAGSSGRRPPAAGTSRPGRHRRGRGAGRRPDALGGSRPTPVDGTESTAPHRPNATTSTSSRASWIHPDLETTTEAVSRRGHVARSATGLSRRPAGRAAKGVDQEV